MSNNKKHHNTIMINGKRYSVNTGKLVEDDNQMIKQPDSSRPIDGLSHADIRPRSTAPPQKVIAHPSVKISVVDTDKPASETASSLPDNHAKDIHNRPKPSPAAPERVSADKPQTPIKVSAADIKPAAKTVDAAQAPKAVVLTSSLAAARAERARAYKKSLAISKFTPASQRGRSAGIPQDQPAVEVQPSIPVAPASGITTPIINTYPYAPKEKPSMAQFHPRYIDTSKTVAAESPAPSEEQKFGFGWPFQRSLVPALAGAMSVLIIVGYVTYLNIPNVSLRVAAARAGISATMPAYRPDGFAFEGPIGWSSGQVVVKFKSKKDHHNYQIVQRKSDWDSQSLLENYVKEQTKDYDTFEDKGLTVYVYGGSNATWVSGGVWYTIDGNSLLNPNQLMTIATSL